MQWCYIVASQLARLPSPVTINEAWSYGLTQFSVMKKIITVVFLLVSLAWLCVAKLSQHNLDIDVRACKGNENSRSK